MSPVVYVAEDIVSKPQFDFILPESNTDMIFNIYTKNLVVFTILKDISKVCAEKYLDQILN
jgi:hypothetical protein